jgi:hypothetical protein
VLTLGGMRPNQRFCLHGLRMLVLAIALLVSPTRADWQPRIVETPTLVVAGAKPTPTVAHVDDQSPHEDVGVANAVRPMSLRRVALRRGARVRRDAARILDRCLLNCVCLC